MTVKNNIMPPSSSPSSASASGVMDQVRDIRGVVGFNENDHLLLYPPVSNERRRDFV